MNRASARMAPNRPARSIESAIEVLRDLRDATAERVRVALMRRAYLCYCERWGVPPTGHWVHDLVAASWELLTPFEQATFRALEGK